MRVSIKSKLLSLTVFLLLLMAVVGGIGLYGFYQSNQELDGVYRGNLKKTALLASIDGLMRASRIQMLLALQHDPHNAFSSLHEHSTSAHTDLAKKYIAEMDQLWMEYSAMNADTGSKDLADAFQKDRDRYIKEGLEPAMAAVLAGNFDETYRITFDVINPAIQQANKSMDVLSRHETDLAKGSYERAQQRYRLFRNAIAGGIVVAIFLGLLAGLLISRSICRSSDSLRRFANKLAGGDFTDRLRLPGQDELAVVGASFDSMAESISAMVAKIAMTTADLAAAASQVHTNSQTMVQGVDAVSNQAVTVATAGEEMAATSGDIARNCQMAADGASLVTDEANKGVEIIQESIRVMSRISERVSATAVTVEALGQRSDQIGQIVGTIEDIADQTNLLALNAAIEAARAGEQGRGFAVVADEVRALAERTTRATREIGAMIKAIQSETRDAVSAMEEGVSEVERGTQEAGRSGEAMGQILEQISNLSMQVSQIATAAEEQTATTSEISSSIISITEVASATSDSARLSTTEANRLTLLAESLTSLLAGMSIEDSVSLCLRRAKSAHMIFTGKIKAHLDGGLSLDPATLPSHLTCAFGTWYQSKGRQSCGQHPVFREIDAPHAKVHDLGKQAVSAYNAGDKNTAARYCQEMVDESQRLIGMLELLEQQCV